MDSPGGPSLYFSSQAWEFGQRRRGRDESSQSEYSLDLGLGAELIYDPLHIPKAMRRWRKCCSAAATSRRPNEYGMSVGFSYTFGSIYNDVVNTRL